jgi:RNA polymerase sigma factor (sigma-70 family)
MQPLPRGESAPPTIENSIKRAAGACGRPRRRPGLDRVPHRREAVRPATATRPAAGHLSDGDVATIVRSAAAGNQEGWDALVREFGGLIRAIAGAYRLRDARAADVAQVTWLRLFEHLVDVREPARVGAWLATTARRECLRVLREDCRQLRLDDHVLEDASPEVPGEDLLDAERDLALWRAFECLRPSDQALLHMLLVADPRPSYDEISAALDIPIGSIGPTRARALERLRQQLDNDGTLTLMTV